MAKDDQFVKFVYCINQRAEKDKNNEIYMKIYKIGESVLERPLVAVKLWVDNDYADIMPES